MSIIGKPAKGDWQLKTGTFGANATPVPTSLYMFEDPGQQVDAGAGGFNSSINNALFQGDSSTGDSYYNFNNQEMRFTSPWGITAFPFTFAAIVRKSASTTGQRTFVGIADASVANRNFSLDHAANEQPRVHAQNTSAINQSVGVPFNNGNWRLVVAVFRSATDRSIYLDGSDVADSGGSVSFPSQVDEGTIGNTPGTIDKFLGSTDIAAVQIWGGVGLSDAQVQTDLWNAGDPWDYLEPSAPPAPPVVDTPIPDQECTVGVPFGPLDVSGNFSDPQGRPLTFTAMNLPNGLTISAAGVISGTPTGGF